MTASPPSKKRAAGDAFPAYRGDMRYRCLACGKEYDIDELLYTCPACGEVLLLTDKNFASLRETSGKVWRKIFDARASTRKPALRGIFRFYEIMAPILDEDDILYLGEGNTPIIAASPAFSEKIGSRFAYKNEGQNPSASFKDRGMACAFSYVRSLARKHKWTSLLTICASTGDTSASAALYASYAGDPIKSVVLLPQGKVTPQQLSQPLGSGATVLEIPGVFDDCMKVVEQLAEGYRVALLNSKNSWRILGQESFSFEVAQWYGWDVGNIALFVPIGNAGNITAIMSGFLKLLELGIITTLPRIFGVQSEHADPVFRYYSVPEKDKRVYSPVSVKPSVAQAAMIGNPVSFPRVKFLAEKYLALGGEDAFAVLQVTEQSIMDSMLEANRHGHIACTQGGESLAGLKIARRHGLLRKGETAVLDSTAHALKFMDFQNMYFTNSFPAAYGVQPDKTRANAPKLVMDNAKKASLDEKEFVRESALAVAKMLGLEKK
ncbi:threonine synthase [Deltaproteobacteria bacterium]|nr:threonine synthase [Deltaproteobacteria bacterium]